MRKEEEKEREEGLEEKNRRRGRMIGMSRSEEEKSIV
jgi:hypothetical protein